MENIKHLENLMIDEFNSVIKNDLKIGEEDDETSNGS